MSQVTVGKPVSFFSLFRRDLPENEWRGVFQHFRPSRVGLNVVHYLQKGIDLRPKAIKNWLQEFKINYKIFDQR